VVRSRASRNPIDGKKQQTIENEAELPQICTRLRADGWEWISEEDAVAPLQELESRLFCV